MKTFELAGELRKSTGKKSAKAFRYEGKVPCVLYGKGENVHFAVNENKFSRLVYTPNSYIVKLNIGGKEETAIVKDIQFHPVSDNVLHVDFARVNTKDPVVIDVPVKIQGLAKGLQAGGKLHIPNRKLRVKALIEYLPDELVVDVTNLGLGKSIEVGSLSFENLELMSSPKAIVAQVKLTRAAKSAEEIEEGLGEGGEEVAESSEKDESTE